MHQSRVVEDFAMISFEKRGEQKGVILAESNHESVICETL